MSAEGAARPRRASTTGAAFLVGLPLGVGFLALVHFGPLKNTPLARYLSHGVECVEVVMFAVALGALAAKVWLHRVERKSAKAPILPPWNGKPVPVVEAPRLLAGLGQMPASMRDSALMQRVRAVLDFLARRGSAAELDDQLRDLADADRDALEGSYALVRFITWAIPILGFLGTVLGITGAIAGVTPERLENDLNSVTDGLALAFDSTALALGLTMLTMFLTYLVERLEEGVLHQVDTYVTEHLAHRFERSGPEVGAAVDVVRDSAQLIVSATQEMVRQQMEVWNRALGEALERSLQAHAERLAALERQMGAVAQPMTAAVAALARTAEGTQAQATALAGLQQDQAQLLQLQETLARNLEALRGAGAFEEAVHSLTAAIHLLTARAAAPSARRPGVAA